MRCEVYIRPHLVGSRRRLLSLGLAWLLACGPSDVIGLDLASLVDAWNRNYSRLGTAKVAVAVSVSTPSLPANAALVRRVVTVSGQRIRSQTQVKNANDGDLFLEEILIYNGEYWQRYFPTANRLERIPSSELAHVPVVDFRHVGAPHIGVGFPQFLAALPKPRIRSDGADAVLASREVLSVDAIVDVEVFFSGEMGLLPSLIRNSFNGELSREVAIDYTELGSVTLPLRVRESFYRDGAEPSQVIESEFTYSDVGKNVDATVFADIDVPLGTLVEDRVGGTTYVRRNPLSREARRLLTIAVVLALIASSAVFVYRFSQRA